MVSAAALKGWPSLGWMNHGVGAQGKSDSGLLGLCVYQQPLGYGVLRLPGPS